MGDLKQHYRILKRSLFTEKVSSMAERSNTYAFEVASNANKIQIRQAVEAIFDVKVLQVRTQTVPGKIKRYGWTQGRTPAWKKALVTLREGDAIHEV